MASPSARTISSAESLSDLECRTFWEHGYLIVRQMADAALLDRMREATVAGLRNAIAPIEYEADLHYPGAPISRNDPGGRTIRRLLQAHSRGMVFTEWFGNRKLAISLRQLLGQPVVMPLAHHNCIMTKQPEFSSQTGWHQDIRYWSYQQPELISAWLALGVESEQNGCLRLIPGSHRMQFTADQLDERRFFRDDHPPNRELIDQHICAELAPGDVLFFHCRTLHSASRNFTSEPKYSVVFTFRPLANRPLPDTRSARSPEVLLPEFDTAG